MSVSRRRVRAIVRKELREYQRNRTIVTGIEALAKLFHPAVEVSSEAEAGALPIPANAHTRAASS